MYSDRYFFHGTHHAARLHSKSAPVYLYLFDYKGNPTEIFAPPAVIPQEESEDTATKSEGNDVSDDQDVTVEVEKDEEDTETEEKVEKPEEILDKIGEGQPHQRKKICEKAFILIAVLFVQEFHITIS